MKTKHSLLIVLSLFSVLLFSPAIYAQETEETEVIEESEEAKLAKATQNPLAAMYSLPFQYNSTYGVGSDSRTQSVLNIQPVIPVFLGENINMVNRIIIPVITQPYGNDGHNSTTGVGDISYTAWFSPAKSSQVVWGVGPVFQIPTASSVDEFGSREFGMGPSLVALTTIDQWVAGVVINNVWTFGDLAENKFLFQYFVNYNLPKAWYLVSGPIITANWNADSDQRWIVPFGGGIGKVFKIGKLPINANAHVYYNAVKPDGYGDWGSRFQLQFIFPKKKRQ